MSNSSYRIRTSPNSGDQQIKIQLDQEYDHLNILSLTLKPGDTWMNRCSNFGVVIGRVSANKGFGLPNAKVSIFIPLSPEDESNPEIVDRYPFKKISDKKDGVRYNLLPSIKQHPTHTPVGTFPTKREILNDDLWIDIYQKYYRFTTRTNDAGDFMFYGVPVGTYVIHYDIDLSDIGDLSVTPFEMIAQGKAENLFDGPYKFRSSKDIDSLAQIVTLDKTITVSPFWGSTDLCDVQITRSDFDLTDKGVELKSYALFIGSSVTDSERNLISQKCRIRKSVGEQKQLETKPGQIEILTVVDSDGDNMPDTIEYLESPTAKIDDNGVWAFLVELNGQKLVKDEYGNESLATDITSGVVKNGFFRFKFSIGADAEGTKAQAKYIVPNNGTHEYAYLFNRADSTYLDMNGNEQIIPGFNTLGDIGHTVDANGFYQTGTLFREFQRKKIYTVRNYIPRYSSTKRSESEQYLGFKEVDLNKSKTPIPFNRMNSGVTPMFSLMCALYSALFFILAGVNKLMKIINTIIDAINDLLNTIIGGICKIFNFILHPCFDLKLGKIKITKKWSINLNFNNICLWNKSDLLPGFCKKIPQIPGIPYISFECCSDCECETKNCYIPFYDCYEGKEVCDSNNNSASGKTLKRCKSGKDCTKICEQHKKNKDEDEKDEYKQACLTNTNSCSGLNGDVSGIGSGGQEDSTYSFCYDSLKQCMLSKYVCESDDIKLEFYNGWMTGLLYFVQIRYKEKVNSSGYLKRAKFCDADWYPSNNTPIPVTGLVGLGTVNAKAFPATYPFRNDSYSTYITERDVFDVYNKTFPLIADAGLVKYWPRQPQPNLGPLGFSGVNNGKLDYIKGEYDDIYYNARQMKRPLGYETLPNNIDSSQGNLLLATEIMTLGSYLSSEDPDNAPFFIQQVPPTTYKKPEQITDFFCFSCTKIKPVNPNLHEKICEFGTDFNDDNEVINGSYTTYSLYVDESSLSGRTHIVSNSYVENLANQKVKITYGSTLLYSDPNTNYYYLGQQLEDTSNPSESESVYVNHVNGVYETKFFNTSENSSTDLYLRYQANPYYMYYGLHPGKTAIDIVHDKFIPKNVCQR